MKTISGFSRSNVLFGGLLALCLSGCDKGVEPNGGEKDYKVYFGDLQSNWKYAYHPSTNVVDSFVIPGSTNPFLSVSPDGKSLYAWGNDEIIEYDVKSSSSRQFWPKPGAVIVAPDEKKAAIFDGDFYLIDLKTREILYYDTSRFFLGAFSQDSRVFYATRGYQVSKVLRLDLRNGIGSDSLTVGQTLCYAIETDADGAGFFLLSQEAQTDVLAHYEWNRGEGDWRQEILPGEGDIQLSGDGKILYISNPGPIIDHGGPTVEPPWTITALDAKVRDTLFEISTITHFDGDTTLRKIPVGPMAVTPDGNWLFGVCTWLGPILSINLQSKQVEHAFLFESRYPSEPVSQSKL